VNGRQTAFATIAVRFIDFSIFTARAPGDFKFLTVKQRKQKANQQNTNNANCGRCEEQAS
jgi:hypothetical protein